MPKQKVSDREQKHRAFRAAIARQTIQLGISKEQQAQMLCISRSSLWAKIRDPSEFRIGELLTLFNALKFSEEEKHILF